jgi:hypothetical protein
MITNQIPPAPLPRLPAFGKKHRMKEHRRFFMGLGQQSFGVEYRVFAWVLAAVYDRNTGEHMYLRLRPGGLSPEIRRLLNVP